MDEKTTAWFGKWIPEFVKAFGWRPALISLAVIVMLALLAVSVLNLLGMYP